MNALSAAVAPADEWYSETTPFEFSWDLEHLDLEMTPVWRTGCAIITPSKFWIGDPFILVTPKPIVSYIQVESVVTRNSVNMYLLHKDIIPVYNNGHTKVRLLYKDGYLDSLT